MCTIKITLKRRSMDILSTLVYGSVPMLLAITLHEVAHGWAAQKLGDLTAQSQGRITLDPTKHIDLYGTIIFPVIMLILSSGAMMFGWAKPIPVNESRLNHPKRDMILVALAGPLANFLMALLWTLSFVLLTSLGSSLAIVEGLGIMSKFGIFINLSFMAFNLIPILPLDGGRIVRGLLPLKLALQYDKAEPYGQYIILALVVFGFSSFFTTPIIDMATQVLGIIF
jgi:Zn-dependent protease